MGRERRDCRRKGSGYLCAFSQSPCRRLKRQERLRVVHACVKREREREREGERRGWQREESRKTRKRRWKRDGEGISKEQGTPDGLFDSFHSARYISRVTFMPVERAAFEGIRRKEAHNANETKGEKQTVNLPGLVNLQ